MTNKNISVVFSVLMIFIFSFGNILPQVNENNPVVSGYIETQKATSLPDVFTPVNPNYIYKELEILKDDFIVNQNCGIMGSSHSSPSIARADNGNILISWLDKRNGFQQVFGQLFNSSKEKIGENFLISELVCKWNSSPSVVFSTAEEFIVVWSPTSHSTYAQRVSIDGNLIGENIRLYPSSNYLVSNSSVAALNNGNFCVAFSSGRYDRPVNINLNIYTNEGVSVNGTTELVTDRELILSCSWTNRQIAVDDEDHIAIVWSEMSSNINKSSIYFQLLNPFGEKIGDNILVTDSTEIARYVFPAVFATNDGYFCVVWEKEKSSSGLNQIGARIIDKSGNFLTDNFLLDENESGLMINGGDGGREKFLVSWYPYKIQQMSKFGDFLGDAGTLPEDSSYWGILSPDFSFIDDSLYVTHLSNYPANNILFQKLDINYSRIGSLFRVNDDTCSANQQMPFFKTGNDGHSILVWTDNGYGKEECFYQAFDSLMNPVGDFTSLNNLPGERSSALLGIDNLNDGAFVVMFVTNPGYSITLGGWVTLQKIGTDGVKIGTNVETGNFANGGNIKINRSDKILTAIYREENGAEVNLRLYNSDLSPISQQKTILPKGNAKRKSHLKSSINDSLKILVCWIFQDKTTGEYENTISAMIFEREGENLTDTLTIAEIDGSFYNGREFNCSIDNNENILLTYEDKHRQGTAKRIYRNKINGDTLISPIPYINSGGDISILRFENKKMFFSTHYGQYLRAYYFNDNDSTVKAYNLYKLEGTDIVKYFDLGIYNDKLYLFFDSNRNSATGYDIWGNLQLIPDIDFDPVQIEIPPEDEIFSDRLLGNFPNPFSNCTEIRFEISFRQKVEMTVYNILGEKVKTIFNGSLEKGAHKVEFNGAGLSSGVYFCKIKSSSINEIVKLLLIK